MTKQCSKSVNVWFILCLAVSQALCSCVDVPNAAATRVWPLPESGADQATLANIREILANTPECSEKLEIANSHCARVEVRFASKPGLALNAKKRVLVIDYGMHTEALTTYRSRVLEFLEPDSDGHLQTTKKTLSIRRGAAKIFAHEIGERNPNFSLRYLQPHTKEIGAKLLRDTDWWAGGHGTTVLSTIAELSPGSEFVLVSAVDGAVHEGYRNILCALDDDDAAFTRMAAFYDNWTQALQQQVKRHQISFINLSLGESERTIRADFVDSCTSAKVLSAKSIERLLQLKLEKFYRPLSSIDGVILVQAGINLASQKLNHNEPSHVLDCTDLPHRVRVGVATKVGDGFEIEKDHQHALACLDTIFSVGPGIFKHAFETSTEEWYCAVAGINVIPCEESTSSAAPLATSYLLYLQEQKPFQTTSQELLEEVKLSDLHRVRDPGARRQFLRMVGH